MLTAKSKAEFIMAMNPKSVDGIIPMGPKVINDHMVELLVADAVKTASSEIADKNLQKRGIALSGKMASKAASGIIASWEDGDICPPIPWPKKLPHPFPFPYKDMLPSYGPDPILPFSVKGLEQAELVSTLLLLSTLTMEKEFNKEIKGLASGLAGGISSEFGDEVDRCKTPYRIHWGGPPRPHGVQKTFNSKVVVG